MGAISPYNLIIIASVIIIFSFFFSELSRKTNIPSVLMLIVLGLGIQFILKYKNLEFNFMPVLEILGIAGLIMIVLEAALELKLEREKLVAIGKAMLVALIGLLLSAWVVALILNWFIPSMGVQSAWLYATPLSVLSSSIIIPSVNGLKLEKKEFHIYESTFSDIFGIMLFYFLAGRLSYETDADQMQHLQHASSGYAGFFWGLFLTVVLSIVLSYLIIIVFQNIKSPAKLFLLIAVLMLLYAVGKQMHLSSLLIILIFGLLIANMEVFFRGPLAKLLDVKRANSIYERLHVVTMESAFVVRTFFFVIFGMTISLASAADMKVALVSTLIIISIYAIRALALLLFMGRDIFPQVFIAPRGLITILLFFNIPQRHRAEDFNVGILLFIIIATGIIMTLAMVYDKKRSSAAINKAKDMPIGYKRWKAPTVQDVAEDGLD
jgi:cell volume regulation protein A